MKAFKDFISRIIDPNVTWDNEYNPEVRVSKTVEPKDCLNYNEVFENIDRQLKLKFKPNKN